MWFFYTISCLILIIGLILFAKNKQIAIWEWLLSALVAFAVSGMFHAIAFHGMTADEEIWSGKVVLAKQYSAWKEYYEEAIYRTEYYEDEEEYTDSEGNRKTRSVTKSRQVFDHWESRRRWHNEYFRLYSNISTEYGVGKDEYHDVVRQFSNPTIAVQGDRRTGEHNSRMIDGDPNDYETRPNNGITVPVIDQRSFVNRIKAAPTVFSYGKVDPKEPVYNYPLVNNWRRSDRLMGVASSQLNQRLWDEMNARLGPLRQVNVIMVGFKDMSIDVAMIQEAKWVGGKKNDMVICYGINGNTNMADWVHVFSWSEREDCKSNLRDIVLQNPINNNMIPLIEKEILLNFVRKDWHKFDYITIEPPTWAYVWFFVVLGITQAGIWTFGFLNGVDKDGVKANYPYRY